MKKTIALSVSFFCSLSFGYSQQGLLDPSFGNNGIVQTDFGSFIKTGSSAQQVLTQPDGTIYVVIVAGGAKITRLLANGTIDKSYGINGYSAPFSITGGDYYGVRVSAAIQADKKIILASSS